MQPKPQAVVTQCARCLSRPPRRGTAKKELRALKFLAKQLLSYQAMPLTKAMKAGELIEIEVRDDG